MSKNRFKNYIEDIEKTVSCDQFLKENKNFIAQFEGKKDFEKKLSIHKALSKRKRFLIFKLLKNRPMCTCALAKVLGTTDGAITHHLNILKEAGLIIGQKEGYYTIYHTIDNLQKYLESV
ncbi:MAG: winged helix-turn-helix domain-containing protein [Promethearchaeia archaeon]